MSKIILITGPTACGKTLVSINLAKKLNAVIINADSRYIFKEPIIATAKVTSEEMSGIKHYMVDTISLNDDFSIYDYQKEGRKLLNKLINENKNIIVVGGSGLYIKALLYDYQLNETEKIFYDYSMYSNDKLKAMADEIDINNDIHVNNRQRLERYITYYKENGSSLNKSDNINNKVYDFISFYLDTDRDVLYDRINKRVDIMINNGLIDEAINLKNFKHFKDIIGYKELIDYFNDDISLEDAIDNIKKDSRHYAKRQITWFKNQMKDLIKIKVNYENIDETINEILNYIE